MCGLHFTLQLNIVFKLKHLHFHSVNIPGVEFITNLKIKIDANLRR